MISFFIAFVISAGLDVQFAYLELGRSFATTNKFENISSELNWLGLSVGVRF